MPDFQPVYGSSIVTHIAYHEPSREVLVKFTNGEIYKYKDVPPEVWEQLLKSASKGKFVNIVLRRGYQYERASASPQPQNEENDGSSTGSKS